MKINIRELINEHLTEFQQEIFYSMKCNNNRYEFLINYLNTDNEFCMYLEVLKVVLNEHYFI